MSDTTTTDTTEATTPVVTATPLPAGVEEYEFQGVMESAYGQKLETPLTYYARAWKFLTPDAVESAGKWPSKADIVDVVNAQEKANARQKGMLQALNLAGIKKPTLETDDQLKLREMTKIFKSAGASETEARAKASAALGIAWAE